ncbi:hypothetical protein [Kineosporia babensis]|uniref:Uncharacterized protein n=1 Tax=Kineosporia babensis TaxID=499548 RepID=A0A9X1N8P2_9ACTN|nr:hypothetical protein [Kineosporia babensis]MCD5310447.1 hypothetical protein [Kineosporia babensis]
MSAPAPDRLALREDVTAGLTAIVETLVKAGENLEQAADLHVAPAPMVQALGRWVAAPDRPLDQRAWIRAYARALSARGTHTSLRELLQELSGGYPVEIADGGGVYREDECPRRNPQWVQVRMPLPQASDRQAVLDLIRAEVPLGVEVELIVVPTPDEPAELFTGPLPQPAEPETAEDVATYVAVPGGPFCGDGGSEDVLPPLFEPVAPTTVPGEAKRLPGAGGVAVGSAIVCPTCAEPSATVLETCPRCGCTMKTLRTPDAPTLEEPRRSPLPDLLIAAVLVALAVAGYLIFS